MTHDPAVLDRIRSLMAEWRSVEAQGNSPRAWAESRRIVYDIAASVFMDGPCILLTDDVGSLLLTRTTLGGGRWSHSIESIRNIDCRRSSDE